MNTLVTAVRLKYVHVQKHEDRCLQRFHYQAQTKVMGHCLHKMCLCYSWNTLPSAS